MPELTRKCKKCNRSVPARDVRLQPDGTFLCFACAGYNPQPGTSSRSMNTPKPIVKDTHAGMQKVKYQCLKCKYEFYIKEGHAKRCPYCAGTNIEEKQGGAQKLLDLSVPMRGDRDD